MILEDSFKPMLASPSVKPREIPASAFPLLASQKIDGIRACITAAGPRARSLKPIPNRYVSDKLATLPVGLDGELVVIRADGTVGSLNECTSAFMSPDGEPDFRFYVFDDFTEPDNSLAFRVGTYMQKTIGTPPWVRGVQHFTVRDHGDVSAFFEKALAAGFEGLILRRHNAPYKYGRATPKSWDMAKVKPREDAEGRIVGFVEQQTNNNEATKNELGRTKRSSAKAGKEAAGTLGALIVQSPLWPGKTFQIGTGFSAKERNDIWLNRCALEGALVTFTYLATGEYEVAREPSFKAIRDSRDLS